MSRLNMMNRSGLSLLTLSLASALMAVPSISAFAQTPTNAKAPYAGSTTAAPAKPDTADAQTANRAQAYYHAALAALYEEEAVNTGRPEFVQHAVDEYKYAL